MTSDERSRLRDKFTGRWYRPEDAARYGGLKNAPLLIAVRTLGGVSYLAGRYAGKHAGEDWFSITLEKRNGMTRCTRVHPIAIQPLLCGLHETPT